MQTAHVNINKEERGNRMYIIQFIRGFCMALADSVPGVSGGTVAFLLGFYDQFIDSIDDLITGNMEKKKMAFFFLIKLGIGIFLPMVGLLGVDWGYGFDTTDSSKRSQFHFVIGQQF